MVKPDGYTSLHYACMSGTPDVVKLLIDKGADVNAADKKGATPLMLAVKSNDRKAKVSFFIPVTLLLVYKLRSKILIYHLQTKSPAAAMSEQSPGCLP